MSVKVLHVLTIASSSGAGGGPLRVAMNQAVALRSKGHDVTIAAAWVDAPTIPPTALNTVPARLAPGRPLISKFPLSSLVSHDLFRFLRAKAEAFDVLHVHAARDAIPLFAMWWAQRRGIPYVTQTHGMIAPDKGVLARVLDALCTRRLLCSAGANLVLTDEEARALVEVAPGLRPRVLGNGVQVGTTPSGRPAGRAPVDVLFCARLHPRKRVLIFLEAARRLLKEGVNATFSIVGPDAGDLARLRDTLATDHLLKASVRYEGALDYAKALERIAAADVYVLPSVDEPFPMSVLEAMAAGVPSIITTRCGIASVLQSTGGAVVCSPSVSGLVDSLRPLLTDARRRETLGRVGRSVAQSHFSIARVAADLEKIYIEVADGS